MGASDAGERRRDHRLSGRRWIAGEQVQIADRRMPQAQRVDREFGARLGGEKGRNRLRRGRERDPAVNPAPAAEASDGGAVGAARVFRTRGAPVLRRGVGGVIKARDRRRQLDDRLEVEPVADIVRRRIGRQRLRKFCRACRRRLRQDSRDGRIVGRHHRGSTTGWKNAIVVVAVPGVERRARRPSDRSRGAPGSGRRDRTSKPAIPLPSPARTRPSRPP